MNVRGSMHSLSRFAFQTPTNTKSQGCFACIPFPPMISIQPATASASSQPGGYADFDNYTVDEPRARGVEREIPLGKTITLTSGADG